MKTGSRGKHSHIGIGVTNANRGIHFLKDRGVAVNKDSMIEKNEKKIAIYLEKENGGFAYHLMKLQTVIIEK